MAGTGYEVLDVALIRIGSSDGEKQEVFDKQIVAVGRRPQSKNLLAADLVELAPNLDPSGSSVIHAATIFRELLLLLAANKG